MTSSAMTALTRPPEIRSEESLPPELSEIDSYRLAARTIVRDEKRARADRLIALVKLVERARRESGLPEWCQRAIWEESAEFIEGRGRPKPLSTEPVEAAVRRLLNRGLIRCPTCRLPLPDERTLDRWRRRRLAEALALSDHPTGA